ncbi:MAG: 1,4-dihydroxy-2-naphthoate octaprenyltransferase [Bacteroidales bacterium]|nr:1,4-dihydroxy-2-naphthoate octaprenyltransferase [Bacteroidales bacterium]
MEEQVKIPFLKKWWISARPFSFPASTMPVIFGTVLAYVYGGYEFKPLLFIMAFFGMVILHSGANILSDIFDYRKGLDKIPSPVSGGIVRGYITIREAWIASVSMLVIGTALGLYLTYVSGPWLLLIGFFGLFVGTFYTTDTPFAMKYHGLGDLAVFLNFGILGSLGAYYVQSATLSWIPVIWAIPMSMLVIAILHANNWRDIQSDKAGKIFTVAALLGDKSSLRYYGLLIYGPFALVLVLILAPFLVVPDMTAMPFTFLITIGALPLAIKLWKKALNREHPLQPLDFIALDGATAQLNLLFGSLCTLALILHAVIRLFG